MLRLTLTPAAICYVLGCPDRGYAGAFRSVRHARFGRVTACASHDPNRFDAGRDLVDLVDAGPDLTRPGAGPADTDRGSGGARVPVHPGPYRPGPGDAIDPVQF